MFALAVLVSAFAVSAQEAEPGRAKVRPKNDIVMKTAPMRADPIPTAVDRPSYNVGAACDLCDPGELATIHRMNFDGSSIETVAQGVRKPAGFDLDPKTGDLWLSANARDSLSEEPPQNKLEPLPLSKLGANFGDRFCDPGSIPDPGSGWGCSCDVFVKPAAQLAPHAGALGLKFRVGKQSQAKCRGAAFIVIHGPGNWTEKWNGVHVACLQKGDTATIEPFMTGCIENNQDVGRPLDDGVSKDGSMLVSDDHAGAIYRIGDAGK